MNRLVARTARTILGLTRPSGVVNRRRLAERQESLDDLIIREAVPADIPALTALHVELWNATYPRYQPKPTIEIRLAQWEHAFAAEHGWFCLLVVRPDGELIGFAKGIPADHPGFDGELSKIYLRWEYHGLGLGRRLMEHVARRFIEQGVTSMILFAEPTNPSCGFYEAMGGELIPDEDGRVHGAYGWRDLSGLAMNHEK